MATVALVTCRRQAFQACIWPTVSHRSYSTAVKTRQKLPSRNAPPSVKSTSAPAKEKATEAKPKAASAASQLEQLETISQVSHIMTVTDMWGSEMPNLDVEIPYDLRLMSKSLWAKPRFMPKKFTDLWYAIKHNTSNWMKNSFSMFAIAKANAFPGIHFKSSFSTWRRITRVQSNSRDSLLAPFRQVALDTVPQSKCCYFTKLTKEMTSGPFRDRTVKAMRQREKNQLWTWEIVSDVSESALFPNTKNLKAPTPVDIVSIRAAEAYLAKEDPVLGNRLVIHALVKFDTTQKIGIFDKRGQPVNSDLTTPRRVVQYLLLEKVGWYDTPWTVKDQMYKV
ncbi:hypothetical protein BU15DRAFT_74339 [Melanogaster broomeanus]|nr:hypothetical protein BU15DRAFT_74339 [Melanogaster broomeanus]